MSPCQPLALLLALSPQDDSATRPVPPERVSTALAAGESFLGPLEVLAVNTPGHPANLVPTLGLPFAPGGGSSSAFGRPYLSANGAHWILEAEVDSGTPDDDVYLFNGQLFLAEGQPAPWSADLLEEVGPLDDRVAINNAGSVLVTNNTTGGSTDDEYVVLHIHPSITLVEFDADD